MTTPLATVRHHLHHLTAIADELCGALGADRAFDALRQAAEEAAPALKAEQAPIPDSLHGIAFTLDLHDHGVLDKAGAMAKIRGLLGISPADPALA